MGSKASFNKKVVIITGAAQGIGAATAELFAKSGAAVVLSDRSNTVNDVVNKINEAGGTAVGVIGDVSDKAVCKQMVDTAIEQFGRLDICFNNAGVAGDAEQFLDENNDDWSRVMAINFNSVVYCCKYQVAAMQGQGGVIINNASVMGVRGFPGSSIEYTASKHAVVGLTKQLALNYAADGIRCLAVCPGFIETPMTAGPDGAKMKEGGRDQIIARIPQGRAGVPEDVAGIVQLLCSDEAAYMTGNIVEVDGGFCLS